MGVVGPLSPATLSDDATVGTVAFSNVANAGLSDDIYATVILLLSQVSHYLKAQGFGFQIPPDAIILGIVVEIERSASLGASIQDSSVKLVKAGVIGGTEKASVSNWPTSDAYATYGSSSDVWGQAWTPVDINLSTFGIAIAVTALAGATVSIDHLRITVYYQGSNRPFALGKQVKVGAGMGGPDFVS